MVPPLGRQKTVVGPTAFTDPHPQERLDLENATFPSLHHTVAYRIGHLCLWPDALRGQAHVELVLTGYGQPVIHYRQQHTRIHP